MEEYTSPTDAAIERLGERQETVHAELLEKMGKMEQVLARLDERPQLLPTFVTSTTFPAVMAGFTDYIGLAMVTPALPFFLFSYFTEDTESLYHNQFCGNPTTLHATPCTASDALSTQCCWSISDNANPGTGTIIPVAAENEIHATISRWTGRITAIQFIFICFANMFWAICGDRVPSMYSLMVTMLGDTACFAGAGFLRRPWEILVIRGATGVSSPLVPAIVYLLDRARSMEQVIEGVANFTLSVVLAYACASIIVAFTYVDIGWKGINIIAAGLNALSLFVVTFYSAAPTRPGPKARPEGAMKAVCTKWFMLHATTGFVQGWQMASMVMMYVLVMKNIFKFNTHQVGAVMFALPCVLLIQNRVCKMATLKYGLNAVTTFGCFLAVANLAVYTIPQVHNYQPTFIVCMIIMQICVLTQQAPNQTRAQKIGAFYAPKAMSAVTGWGRVFFALGQGIGPYVASDLFAIRPMWGFLACLIVQLIEVLMIIICADTIPLFRDQDPPKPMAVAIEDKPDAPPEIEMKSDSQRMLTGSQRS